MINWITQFVPMKWDAELKVSALNTEIKLIEKCIIKKDISRKADSDMATFFPIEDFKNPLIILKLYLV